MELYRDEERIIRENKKKRRGDEVYQVYVREALVKASFHS